MKAMTTWVLLRGLMREQRHWGDFVPALQARLGGQQLVSLDFSGNGTLHAQNSAISVTGMLQDCRRQLAQLGHTPPYSVIGLSLGAMVAVAWSEQQSAELERMVLINTSLAPHNAFYQRLRPRNYLALLRVLLTDSVAQRERRILELSSNTIDVQQRQKALAQWISYAQECPVTRSNMLRQLFAAMSFRAAVAPASASPAVSLAVPPPVPRLLLAAQQDRLVSVQCSVRLAQRWHCPLKIHTSAGHDLPLDDASWVIRQITDWLDS